MLIALILAVVYLVSLAIMYTYFRISFSKGGQWEGLDADAGALCFTLIPALNSVAGILFWVLSSPWETPKFTFNRFFNIKK